MTSKTMHTNILTLP